MLILISRYVLKSSYTTFSLTGLLCFLLLMHIVHVFSPELDFCFAKEEKKKRAETIVSRTSADVLSHVTRFNSDDEEEESDDEDNMLRMNTTMVESKVHDEEKKSFSSIVMNLDVDDDDDENIPLPPPPPHKRFPSPEKKLTIGEIELGNIN